MSESVPISKDEEEQRPVPSEWRDVIFNIVKAITEGDFRIERGIHGVRPVSAEDASRIARNIKSYGARLINLPEEAWQTSACQWMCGYWDVLIDLFTIEEGPSDLVLSLRVYEEGPTFTFEIQTIHVP